MPGLAANPSSTLVIIENPVIIHRDRLGVYDPPGGIHGPRDVPGGPGGWRAVGHQGPLEGRLLADTAIFPLSLAQNHEPHTPHGSCFLVLHLS